ncbi:MAG: thioredoxin domain-containing protein [Candidatus Binatia bacterium]
MDNQEEARPRGHVSTFRHLALLSLLALLALTSSAAGQSLETKEMLAVLARGPSKGSERAPVTIIEFSDFQCSFCWKFWKETLPRLDTAYIQPGKVRFVYRHLAILGAQSVTAAQAAECAREQGKFWEYHDKVFTSKGRFASFALINRRLKGYAREVELDGKAFDRCLDSGKYAQKIEEETGMGRALRARATPTFFINGKMLVGAHPFETFQRMIEEELGEGKQR